MISHELKTPLTPIKGYCEMLIEPNLLGPLSKDQEDAVIKIKKESSHLLNLIEKILLVRKMETNLFDIIPSEVFVDELVSEICGKYSKELSDKKIDLEINGLEHTKIKIDAGLIEQVFSNILNNAIDFVPQKDGKIQIQTRVSSDQITFSISNNGPEIPQKELENLFKKFYQLDTSLTRPHEGSGLGLAICKGVVESHGGKIWAESDPYKTTFTFTIPRE